MSDKYVEVKIFESSERNYPEQETLCKNMENSLIITTLPCIWLSLLSLGKIK